MTNLHRQEQGKGVLPSPFRTWGTKAQKEKHAQGHRGGRRQRCGLNPDPLNPSPIFLTAFSLLHGGGVRRFVTCPFLMQEVGIPEVGVTS